MNRRERQEFRMEMAELLGDVFQEASDHGGRSLNQRSLRAVLGELGVAAHVIAQNERDAIFKDMIGKGVGGLE